MTIRRFANAKWEAFVDELLGEFFEVYVGVGWDVLVLMGDCWLLLCGCGNMGGHLGCYLRGDGRTCGCDWVPTMLGSLLLCSFGGLRPDSARFNDVC